MSNSQNVKAPRPNTDLDFQQQLTDTFFSSEFMDNNFTNKFREFEIRLDDNGESIKNENGDDKIFLSRDLWAVLQIFNRDWRLGNIDTKREAIYIRHYLDLSSDILITLGDDFREPALISLERALAVNETSQSKGGFLRKMLNTFIHKTTPNVSDGDEKTKRNLLGFGKRK